jgi:hypothetical protein
MFDALCYLPLLSLLGNDLLRGMGCVRCSGFRCDAALAVIAIKEATKYKSTRLITMSKRKEKDK